MPFRHLRNPEAPTHLPLSAIAIAKGCDYLFQDKVSAWLPSHPGLLVTYYGVLCPELRQTLESGAHEL